MKITVKEKSAQAALDALVKALERVPSFRLVDLKAKSQGEDIEVEINLDVREGGHPVAISGRYSVGTSVPADAVRAAEEWVAWNTALPGPKDETWAVSPAFEYRGMWWAIAVVASPK